jgi:hypothetical protein
MDGFPDQFVKKGDVDTKIVAIELEIKNLVHAKSVMEGKASQRSMIITLIIAIVGLVISLGGLLRHFKI